MALVDGAGGGGVDRQAEQRVELCDVAPQARSVGHDEDGGRQRGAAHDTLSAPGDLRTVGEVQAEPTGAVLARQLPDGSGYPKLVERTR